MQRRAAPPAEPIAAQCAAALDALLWPPPPPGLPPPRRAGLRWSVAVRYEGYRMAYITWRADEGYAYARRRGARPADGIFAVDGVRAAGRPAVGYVLVLDGRVRQVFNDLGSPLDWVQPPGEGGATPAPFYRDRGF